MAAAARQLFGARARVGADRFDWQPSLVQFATILLVLFLVAPPVAMLVFGSLWTGDPGAPGSLSLRAYQNLLRPQFLQTLSNTLLLTTGGALFAVANGVILAFLLWRTDTPGRVWLSGLVSSSFYIPTFMSAAGWFLLGSPNAGAINQAARWVWPGFPGIDVLSMPGMIWVMGLTYTPYVFLLLRGPLLSMDPSLEEAAWVAGAGRLRCLVKVTLPLLTYGLLSGFLVTFVLALGNFGVPGVLGFPARKFVLATEAWSLTQFYPADYNTAAALAIVLISLAATAVLFQRLVVSRREYTAITGKGYRPRVMALGPARWLAAFLCWFYGLVAIGLPVAVLLYSSLIPVWTLDLRTVSFSLDNYHRVLFEHPLIVRSFANSTILSFVGATAGIMLAGLVSYFTIRGRSRVRAPLDIVSSLPLAMPGLAIGLGLVWTYVSLPIGIYGTIWILILSYVTHYLPHAVRAVSANMIQLDNALEEAARVSGGSWGRSFRKVVLPLVRPGMVGGWLVLVVTFYRELSSAVMLYTPDNQVISVVIWGLYLNAEWGLLSALSIVVLLIIFLIFMVAAWLGGRGGARASGLVGE